MLSDLDKLLWKTPDDRDSHFAIIYDKRRWGQSINSFEEDIKDRKKLFDHYKRFYPAMTWEDMNKNLDNYIKEKKAFYKSEFSTFDFIDIPLEGKE